MSNPIPLMILSPDMCKKIATPFKRIAGRIEKSIPTLKKDIKTANLEINSVDYIAYTIINFLILFILFFGLMTMLSYRVNHKPINQAITLGLAIGLGISFVFAYLLIRYPKIIAGKLAEEVDKNLVFALKDLMLQLSSGVTMYNAMINISKSGYGQVSTEFEKTAQDIAAGISMTDALERMIDRCNSKYLRKTIWQLINTLKAGSSMKQALRSLIDDLMNDQRTKIRGYAQELNLWCLLYMLFAVAIPTLGATMLVILSSFAGFQITAGTFVFFIIISFVIQIALIGFIKSRRPNVDF